MKYLAPLDATDPDAPYVDGDEATSTLGSIPPAAAFEGMQREMQHVITEAGLTPNPSNWTQLYAAITTIISEMIATALASITTVFATVAEILTGTATKTVNVANLWGAGAFVALTDASTIAIDLATGINFSVTLGGNRILDNPTHPKVGQSGMIKVVQDGTGGRTLSFASNYKFFDGLVPDLKTTAGAVNVLHYEVLDSTTIAISYIRGLA